MCSPGANTFVDEKTPAACGDEGEKGGVNFKEPMIRAAAPLVNLPQTSNTLPRPISLVAPPDATAR